ncbi:SpoIID/LytB domain-containing protein [Bacteriovorax sp. Seq25_V]|uniref:SpoIID/LytB domain-containing protein n=1 Tax=Bacteriovorax sp. Seq25_V TaxID=1201288 RepID=UPI000389FB73|nr:SpoIID/LytB domain-containing protein [Bacteriovorax sp. Seq25_V]EQC46240.1 stage II sporulation protein [Bacteriovorax sp. Seq25_V]
MKKLLLLTLLGLLSSTLFANDEVFLQNSSSSIPPNFERGTLPIPEDTQALKNIRVLIFPHTLKNDWRHGVPDNATTFKIKSPDSVIITDNKISQKITDATITFKNKTIYATVGKKKISFNSPITFTAKRPILIERLGNETKSNSYYGKFKVGINESGLYIVNTIDMENYLLGVVPSESSASWPIESLKAQALAARSYALYHLLNTKTNKDWDVDDTARYQVYTGINHRKPSTDKAVNDTAGEVITYNGEVIVAFFHSYSGGYTDSAKNIFGSNEAPYCDISTEVFTRDHLRENLSKSSQWIVESRMVWKKSEIIKKLKERADTAQRFKNFDINGELSFNILTTNVNFDSARDFELIQGDNREEIYFRDFRAALGWSNFKGYHYYFEDETPTEVTIKGYGWGHHVGMSQWGAYMMSKYFDYKYDDIIKHYYHNIEITKI